MRKVIVSGAFSEINSRMFRFMHEASRHGRVQVLLWTDELIEKLEGFSPRFSLEERAYVLDSLRYVDRISTVEDLDSVSSLPEELNGAAAWVIEPADQDAKSRRRTCAERGLDLITVSDEDLGGYPEVEIRPGDPNRKKILVTGCYDWFHSGHVRFFEEVSALGELYVVVGHDENLRLLKGEGHPMFPQEERRYMAQSIRFVHQALVSTGHGWMDAEPEIERLKIDAYAVNEDGDRPEKREFCKEHGLEYIVLKRLPKEGLTRRSSTDLRGF